MLKPYKNTSNIETNHLKFCPDIFLSLLSRFFTCCLSHSYLPDKISNGVITPILKNKFLDPNCLNNHRPVIQSSIFLKIIEHCLLKKIHRYFTLNDRQHGFRSNLSTTTACFSLKETVHNYFDKSTPVYAAFLDYSKAFDNVSHNILFSKLHESGVPALLLRFIWYWYSNQNIVVKYEGCLSSSWKLLSAVRQGGILSPLFFNIYINSMINDISCSKYACRLGLFKSNILAYADDIVILSPSLFGLQKLLDLSIYKSNKL